MRYLLLHCFIFSFFFANSQDGKIIEQVQYTLPDSSVAKIAKTNPAIKAVVEAVNFYRVTYLSDGLKVKAYLAVPKVKAKYPCIIHNRGGSLEYGAYSDESFVRYQGKLAHKGYIIVAPQYRGNGGGEGKEEYGGRDLNDVLNLIPLLNHLPQADTSRIGMSGMSRGSMMTYLALTKTTNIKAAVIRAGPTNLMKVLEARPNLDTVWAPIVPAYSTQKEQALRQRSAIYFAENINRHVPILILHGTADWQVPADQAIDIAGKFYQLKQPFRLILYEGGNHSLSNFGEDSDLQVETWFNTYLRDRRPWPSLQPPGN